jgi:hypothetical protein
MSYTENNSPYWYCILCHGTEFFVKKDDRWDLIRKLAGLDPKVCTKCHILMKKR